MKKQNIPEDSKPTQALRVWISGKACEGHEFNLSCSKKKTRQNKISKIAFPKYAY